MSRIFKSPETRAKLEGDKRRLLQARSAADVATAASSRPPSAYSAANSDYVRGHAQEQAQLRREQDAGLDRMGNSLDRLAEMADTIGNELKEQDKILTDVSEDIDKTQSKMDGAMRSIEKLLKTKSTCQLAVIAGLTLTFVIVAVIALYTITG